MSAASATGLRYLHNEVVATAHGSEALALYELANAGPDGCTAATHPGPNWPVDVQKWRKRGLIIESVPEPRRGAMGGQQVRYVLRSQIEVLDLKEAA